MLEISIVEERISKKFLDDLGHYIRIDGELETAYFISADGEDYIEQNINFLLEFLIHQNKFDLGEVTEWGIKRKRSRPTFKIESVTTFITIAHDGAGVYLFSNEDKYFPLLKFISTLPKGTIISQINDKLVTDEKEI